MLRRFPLIYLFLIFSISANCLEIDTQRKIDEIVADIKKSLVENNETICLSSLNRLLILESVPDVVSPLLKQCISSNFSIQVKIRASWGLARLKVDKDKQVGFLFSIASDEKNEDVIRIDAVRLLVLLKEDDIIHSILDLYSKCKSIIIRSEIIDLIKTQPVLNDKGKTALLACVKNESHLGLRALGIVVLSNVSGNHEQAHAFVMQLAKDDDENTRLAVAVSLARFSEKRAESQKILREYLSDSSVEVRIAAAGSLAKLGVVDEEVSNLIVGNLNNSKLRIRAYCLGVIHLLHVTGVEDRVTSYLQDESDVVRKAAIEALKLLREKNNK